MSQDDGITKISKLECAIRRQKANREAGVPHTIWNPFLNMLFARI